MRLNRNVVKDVRGERKVGGSAGEEGRKKKKRGKTVGRGHDRVAGV